MDFVDIDNVKLEKANAMKKYNQLQRIRNFFRIFEICLVLILFSWFSTRLPNVIQILEKYFREFCIILVSPRFVFFLGNAIILTLFINSGKLSGDKSAVNNGGDYIYEEFIKKSSETNQKIRTDINPSPHYVPEEEIVYQDKQTVYEEKNYTVPSSHTYNSTVTDDTQTPTKITKTNTTNKSRATKYRRSQSEISKRSVNHEKPKRELRRSETEKCRKSERVVIEEPVEEEVYSEEVMSNEEFQRTIEEFIAKQVRFRREESMAIVLQ